MLALVWRFLMAISDWRVAKRKFKGQPTADVVLLTNLRNKEDRKRYLGIFSIFKPMHFNGFRFKFFDITGRMRIINSIDLSSISGRKIAKKQALSAIGWAKKKGAGVVLFAAGTKRLFTQNELEQIQKLYPDIIFTIGDNGTALVLQSEIINILQKTNLYNSNSKILVTGASGFLGNRAVKILKEHNINVIGVSRGRADQVHEKYGIPVYDSLLEAARAEMDIDAVVTCTHEKSSRLNSRYINMLKRKNRKLVVIDPSEQYNLSPNVFSNCRNLVNRFDAGNAYSKSIKYIFGKVTARFLKLDKNLIFGCFAEAFALAYARKHRIFTEHIFDNKWLDISDKNLVYIRYLFSRLEIEVPYPRNYSRRIPEYKKYNNHTKETVLV